MIEREAIHPDDLIPVLVPALELDDKLRDGVVGKPPGPGPV